MDRQNPFVSVVVPTRNRPRLLRYCLESLKEQSFTHFEVIVSDNHTGTPCKDVFDEFADDRFRYVKPSSPFGAMHDSWEFACSFATGKYVAVLIDKTILRPSALQIMYTTLQENPAEIVSWWNDSYVPFDESRGYDRGRYVPLPQEPCAPRYFDTREELARRFRLDVRRGTEGVHYYWGKICFGAYHRDLIHRIRMRIGRLFYPACPDYTSMIAALAYAKNAVDVGQPLLISFQTSISTGRLTEERDDFAAGWIATYDPSLRVLDKMPLKGLYTSMHNIVAADYVFMKKTIGEPMEDLVLDMPNLVLRAREDLDIRKVWQDESRRRTQYGIWREYFAAMPHRDRARFYWRRCMTRIARVKNSWWGLIASASRPAGRLPLIGPFVRRRWYRLATKSNIKTFDNIVDAARYADSYYGAILERSRRASGGNSGNKCV
jgi:hypothetical protein